MGSVWTHVRQRQHFVNPAGYRTAETMNESLGAGHEVARALPVKPERKQDAFDFLEIGAGESDRIWKAREELLCNRFDRLSSCAGQQEFRNENGEGIGAVLAPEEVTPVFPGPFDDLLSGAPQSAFVDRRIPRGRALQVTPSPHHCH